MKKPVDYQEALARCAELCNRCEQCTPDLIEKMKRWGLGYRDAQKVIEELEEMRYVDDHRFVRAYAHDKVCFSGWGRYKVERGLMMKRLPRTLVGEAMEGVEEEEYHDVACRVTASKLRQLRTDNPDYETKVKVLRHVLQRGFEMDVARRALREVLERLEREREEEEEGANTCD